MKRIVLALFMIFDLLTPVSYAAGEYEEILSERIKNEGIFEDSGDIIYAGRLTFENVSMLIADVRDNVINCRAYDNTDGIQLTDIISFDCGRYPSCRLGIVKHYGRNYILFSHTDGSNTVSEFFTVENDAFVPSQIETHAAPLYIAGYDKGRIISYASKDSVYTLLLSLKQEYIDKYGFTDRTKNIENTDINKMKAVITACADLMSFDIKDYSYDNVFKYVLHTNENFRILTDIPSNKGESISIGGSRVSMVSCEYIDYVMKNILRITPRKPPMNDLLTRGFCLSEGYYLYTGGFDVYFATEIVDIKRVYELGGDVFFIIFSDIYREGDISIPEYSFAVLQKSEGEYSLLRLGMGEILPTERQIRAYSPFSDDQKQEVKGIKTREAADVDPYIVLPSLFVVFSVGLVGFVCGITALVNLRRKHAK